jgi:hypothetical protein
LLRLDGRLTADSVKSEGRKWLARPLAAQADADRRARAFAEALRDAVAGGQAMQTALSELTLSALRDGGASSAVEAAALESRDRPQVDVSASFSRVGVINPIPNADKSVAARQLAFTLEKVGDVYPEPILTRDGVAVLQLKEKDPVSRADFDEERTEVLRDFRQQAQLDALASYVERLREAAQDKINVNARYLDASQDDSDDS